MCIPGCYKLRTPHPKINVPSHQEVNEWHATPETNCVLFPSSNPYQFTKSARLGTQLDVAPQMLQETRRKILSWTPEFFSFSFCFTLDVYMGVSKNRGTPKSSILIGFSIINHPFWDTSFFGNTHIYIMKMTSSSVSSSSVLHSGVCNLSTVPV